VLVLGRVGAPTRATALVDAPRCARK
jgi:hypothetical protein